MSRSCNDCTLDGNCELQKKGFISCSNGSDKTYEQRIKDIDNRVVNLIETLQDISDEYVSWDIWDKVKDINDALDILKKKYEKELIEKYAK